MTDQSPFPQRSKEPRLYGVVDILRADRVAGWVIDRTDAGRCASIEIRQEGRLLCTVTANRPRKDLERQAVGTGAYGFAYAFDPPLEEGMEFTINVTARTHDGISMLLQPVANAAKAVSPERKALGRILAEIAVLRTETASLRQALIDAGTAHSQMQERLEITQLRLESSISTGEPADHRLPGWLVGVAVTGALIGCVSLAVGIFSLWAA